MEAVQQFNSSDASSALSSKKKPWEHPWTVDEMKKSAEHWNLASDVGMLLHLQEFSQKLLKQTHDIQEQVDSLNHDTKLTNVRLHNVFNDFVMLANTQFMENRVYDEEVAVQEQTNGNKKTEEKEKTQQEKEMELIPKIKQAISFGLNVFDTAYEKLDMNIANSESDDDDNSATRPNIILEPKDPYLLRPLPYLIGSEQFFQSDNLGLASLLVDESEDQDSDHQSDVEQDGSQAVQPPEKTPIKYKAHVETSSSESDEDLFSESKTDTIFKKKNDDDDEEEEESDTEVALGDNKAKTAKSPMSDLQSELAKKLGDPGAVRVPPKRQKSVDKEPHAKPRPSKIVQQPPLGGDDIFGSAIEDPNDDIFSRPGRPFSSRPTLFDDEDDDSGGLFIPKKNSQPKQDQQIPVKTSDFSSKSIDFDAQVTSTPQSTGQGVKETKKIKEEKSLFDQEDDDDDEEDLFAAKPVAASRQAKEIRKPGASLFVDDEENDDSDIFGTKTQSLSQAVDKPSEVPSKPKIPAGAVSIFGGGDNLFKAAVLKTRKDDDMDNSSMSFPKPSSLAQSSKLAGSTDAPRPIPGSNSPSTASNSSLFAEDPEMFAAPSKSKPTVDLKKEPSQTKAKSGLSLFSADDEEDDLFATMSKPLASTGTKTLAKEPEPAKKANKFLFDDDDDGDDEGDLFSFSKPSTIDDKKNLKLIDETASKISKPEIKPAERKEPSREQTKEAPKPKATKVSLFSSSDEEDDFFSGSSKKSPAKLQALEKSPAKLQTPEKSPGLGVTIPVATGRSLFDDDDFLFGKSSDNGPGVDLFKSPVAKKTEIDSSSKITSAVSPSSGDEPSETSPATTIPVQHPATSKPKEASTKLFGSFDDEDDLFSTLKTKPLDKTKAASKPHDEVSVTQKTSVPVKTDIMNEQKDISEDIVESKTTTKKKPPPALPHIQDTNKTLSAKPFDDPLNLTITSSDPPQSKSTVPSKDPLAALDRVDNQTLGVSGANLSVIKEKSPTPTSPTSPKPIPKVTEKTNSRISQLQASMNIDPTAHLPQKNKKIEENMNAVAVNFDLPPQAATLHSLAKDRAKIPIKRRPPTRKHVESQEDQNDGFLQESFKQDTISGALTDPTVQKTEQSVSHPFKNDLISEAKESPGTLSNNDEPFGLNQKQNLVPSINSANNITESRENQVYTDGIEKSPDLQSTPEVKAKKSSGKTSQPASSKFLASDDDDLFDSKTLKTASAVKSRNAVASSIVDKDDDLFGESDLLSSSGITTLKQKAEREKATLSSGQLGTGSSVKPNKVDDDDDLFGVNVPAASSKLSNPRAPPEDKGKTVANRKEEILPKTAEGRFLSSDEDDIFSGPKKMAAPSSKATSKAAPVVAKQADDDDDDDDIFASSSIASKASSSKPSQVKPKIQSPFDDDGTDDIFANVPPSSSQTKTQLKKEQIADEDDDLFVSSSRSARPAYKKPVTKDEDLFHDDTDIFADIPSSKSKDKKSMNKNVRPVTAVAFSDQSDDIFAESVAGAKPKQNPLEIQKPAAATQSNDFDDIFEDPLNVLKK